MKEYKIKEVGELQNVAKEVIGLLSERSGDGDGKNGEKKDSRATVLALHGDLGAGKTTFMQILARELGVVEQITSPTFVIMKKYDTEHSKFKHLVHIDAYRIESIDEMAPLRFRDELTRQGTIIGIEWAENIAELLPAHTLHMNFIIDDRTRIIKLSDGKKK